MSQEWFERCTCLNENEEHPCPFELKKRGGDGVGCTCCPWCTSQCDLEEPVT